MWQDTFLEEFIQTFDLSRSANLAGVSRSTVLKYLKIDADFNAAFEDAKQAIKDGLKAAALSRAKNGFTHKKTVMDGNGTVTQRVEEIKPETALTVRMLEALEPETFKPTQRIEIADNSGEQRELRKSMMTMAVQNCIDAGMDMESAMEYLIRRGVKGEDLSLIEPKDLTLPQALLLEDNTPESEYDISELPAIDIQPEPESRTDSEIGNEVE